jgi:hypothetical protein
MSAAFRRAAIGFSVVIPVWFLTGCTLSREHGQQLFEFHCAECHEMANPDLKKQPPKLEGLFRSKTLPSGAPATDDQVRRTVIEGLVRHNAGFPWAAL